MRQKSLKHLNDCFLFSISDKNGSIWVFLLLSFAHQRACAIPAPTLKVHAGSSRQPTAMGENSLLFLPWTAAELLFRKLCPYVKSPKLAFRFLLHGPFGLGSKTDPLNVESILIVITD